MPVVFDKFNKTLIRLKDEILLSLKNNEQQITGVNRLTLAAAAEAGNAIVVTGTLKKLDGSALTSQPLVKVTTHAPTAAKGVITTVTGVEKTNEAITTKTHAATIAATAGGSFSVSIADDQVEAVSVVCEADGCVPATLLITYA